MKQRILTVDDKLRTLGGCSVFADVPATDLGVLAEIMETERLGPGDVLFEYGEPSDRIYVVVSGRLAVLLPGAAEPVRTLDAGELLGEYGMFANFARTASVKAETDAVLLSLDYRRFRAFLLQFPESTLAVLTVAVQRLVEHENEQRDPSP